jgi:hypothetical protein
VTASGFGFGGKGNKNAPTAKRTHNIAKPLTKILSMIFMTKSA